jgi:hypothetical protein
MMATAEDATVKAVALHPLVVRTRLKSGRKISEPVA